MIYYGIALLVIGIVAWAVGRGIPSRITLIVGQALCGVGGLLLVAGLVLLIINGGLHVPAPAP